MKRAESVEVYVARFLYRGEQKISKPCKTCAISIAKLAKKFLVRVTAVHYTTSNEGCIATESLDSCVSTGVRSSASRRKDWA